MSKKVLFTCFTIEPLIFDNDLNQDWWCVCIYASDNDQFRRAQWNLVSRRKLLLGNNWIIMGDMNKISSNRDIWGARVRSENSFKDFKTL